MTITERLLPILSRPIEAADRRRATLLYLDWIGCATAGSAEPVGQKLNRSFGEQSGPCTRLGGAPHHAMSGHVQMAAFHNGCLGNVLEMDDVDRKAVLHAAPTVIPAALAALEHAGADFQAFLDAIIIGYEVTLRIGRAVGAGHYAFWHNTATCGPFGAAAAVCHILQNTDIVAALGLAGTQSAGLWQTRHEPESDAKQVHAGHAAQVGVMSAMMSAQGIKGPRKILEGEQGFFKAMCPGANPEDVLRDPDGNWLIHETSIKPYPACRHSHAAIDAALSAAPLVLHKDGIILIETYDDALKFCDRSEPSAGRAAKFSLQHVVAYALQYGVAPDLSDFAETSLSSTKKLRRKIILKSTDEFNHAYPAHYGAAVTVGGKRYVAKDALGDPEHALSNQAVFEKAIRLFRHAGQNREHAVSFITTALGEGFENRLGIKL